MAAKSVYQELVHPTTAWQWRPQRQQLEAAIRRAEMMRDYYIRRDVRLHQAEGGHPWGEHRSPERRLVDHALKVLYRARRVRWRQRRLSHFCADSDIKVEVIR